MEINRPDIVAQVTAAHDRYEAALAVNDLDTLDELFWDDGLTLRYGPNGSLYGHAAISAFRRGRAIAGVERTVTKSVITTFGDDFATTNIEYVRPDGETVGRQSQAWARFGDGWHIVAAHVSDVPA